MRGVIKVLAVAALMATTISPAFAQPPEHAGEYGFGTDKDKQDITTGNEGIGYACGQLGMSIVVKYDRGRSWGCFCRGLGLLDAPALSCACLASEFPRIE